ncbi:MAG: prenyltransferase/squalene oxidase repeat-containing protein [Candidatus Levyibacteriota bacterium]
MNKLIQKRALTLLVTITFVASTLFYYTPVVSAAGVPTHVRVVGSSRTIWYGDVTTDGCTITDTDNKQHVYTQPFAVCALDAAAKTGGFTYALKDFGDPLGLFLQTIAGDTGASDFSTSWSYDLNGKAASEGISSQVVSNGDTLYFHFDDPNADPNKRAVNDGITYLKSQQQNSGQISGIAGVSQWATSAFVAAGIDPTTLKNGSSTLVDFLTANPPTTSAPATDWERDILAITASGKDPYNFGGVNYVQNLESYNTNSQLGVTTQINDDIFGLLALVSAGSSASMQAKQDAFNFILSHQGTDGGFSWSTTGITDVDDTAAALQALVAAKNSGMTASTLETAITNAKVYILAAKNTDGGFASVKGDVSNTSTTSWAIMALSAAGDTGADITNADAYMRGNQEENGSFKWQPSSTGETFTTSYAVLALTGKYWPVKTFGGTASTPSPTASPSPTPSLSSTPTPSPTVTPTPSPTVTVTSTPVPTVSPKPNNMISDIWKREQKKLKQIQEQQKRIFERILAQIQKELDNLSKLFNAFGKHY